MPERTRGPLPGALGVLLALPYRFEVARRNRRFDRGKGVVRFDRVVVSVGNLSVGGTGKTPMVQAVLRWLLEAEHRPVVAMRGYKGKGGESDEAAVHRQEFPEVPVVAQADRALGLIRQFGKEFDEGWEPSDVVVLDDGFQHRRIAREVDIVLIDATRSPFQDRVLPLGWLREPVASLRRATHLVVTHAEAVGASDLNELVAELARVCDAPVAIARHAWVGLTVHDHGRTMERGIEFIARRRVAAVCAIGNPGAFLRAVRAAAGAEPAKSVVLRDHDPYRDKTVSRVLAVARGADFVVTTAKDWAKLSRVEAWPCPVVVPRLEMRFDSGEAELRAAVLDAVARGAPE